MVKKRDEFKTDIKKAEIKTRTAVKIKNRAFFIDTPDKGKIICQISKMQVMIYFKKCKRIRGRRPQRARICMEGIQNSGAGTHMGIARFKAVSQPLDHVGGSVTKVI